MLYLYIEDSAWQDQNKISSKIAVWKNEYAIQLVINNRPPIGIQRIERNLSHFFDFFTRLLPENVVHI
jgi:hypothetical protein